METIVLSCLFCVVVKKHMALVMEGRALARLGLLRSNENVDYAKLSQHEVIRCETSLIVISHIPKYLPLGGRGGATCS